MPTFSGGKDDLGGGGLDGKGHLKGGYARKERVALQLDPDVLRKFKDTGQDWQQLINSTLRRALEDGDDA